MMMKLKNHSSVVELAVTRIMDDAIRGMVCEKVSGLDLQTSGSNVF